MVAGLLAAAVVLALLLTRKLGYMEGEYIDVGMLDVVLPFSQVVSTPVLTNPIVDPADTRPICTAPSCNVYRTADRKYITLVALEPAFWEMFCDVIDRLDLTGYHFASDDAVRNALRSELAAVFALPSRDEREANFEDVFVPVAPVKSIIEVLEGRHVSARDLLTPSGTGQCINFPARMTTEDGAN